MISDNAKDQASGTRRDEKACWYSYYPNSSRGFGYPSEAPGNQSLGAYREDWERSNLFNRTGDGEPGKILDQLIEETQQQLEHHLQQAEKLGERREALELLRQQLHKNS